MNPYFYSLEMLVTSRGWSDHPNLTGMDVLAADIAKEAAGEPFEPHSFSAICIAAAGHENQRMS